MSIVEKINNEDCSIDELDDLLSEKNPIILYHVIMAIGNTGKYNEEVIKKLYSLSAKRAAEDTLLGRYRIGHLAIITLQKIGSAIEEIPAYQTLDEYERKTVFQLAKEVGW